MLKVNSKEYKGANENAKWKFARNNKLLYWNGKEDKLATIKMTRVKVLKCQSIWN
jgi:hypothetical protein